MPYLLQWSYLHQYIYTSTHTNKNPKSEFIVDTPNQLLYCGDPILVAKRPRVAFLPK